MKNKWPLVTLGDLLTPLRQQIEIDPLDIYKQVTVKLHHKGVVIREEINGSTIKSKQYRASKGQFIISRIDARNGAMGLIPPELDGAIVTNDFLTYDVNEDKLLPEYFDYLTSTEAFVKECIKASEGTTNRVRLRPEKFLNIEIFLPSLEGQKRIVAKIERSMAKVEEAKAQRQQAYEELGLLSTCAFRQAFSVPKGVSWDNLPVEQCCEAIIDYRGRTPPIASEGIPHVTSANIRNGRVDWNTSKSVSDETYAAYMTRGIPQKGDVIFTMEAPLGEAAVVPDNRKFSLAQRTLLLRAKPELMSGEFLARALTSPSIRLEIIAKATKTTVRGIASKRLRTIVLSVPSIEQQRRIVAYLHSLQAKVDELKRLQAETGKELEELVPSILDKAFKGEL